MKLKSPPVFSSKTHFNVVQQRSTAPMKLLLFSPRTNPFPFLDVSLGDFLHDEALESSREAEGVGS